MSTDPTDPGPGAAHPTADPAAPRRRRRPERSALAVAHRGLAAAADVEPWRVVWRDLLRRL
ncbi:hypothetical protein [Kocuria flava]|uniref:hypothetical protein n=1 Tax=Kocuria flava TaxID=446860 RepID=UPI00117F595E|nr:hypothetical protein [Kocuria flava]